MLSCSEVRGKKYSPKGRPGSTPNNGPIWQKKFCQIDVKIVVQPNDPPESSVRRELYIFCILNVLTSNRCTIPVNEETTYSHVLSELPKIKPTLLSYEITYYEYWFHKKIFWKFRDSYRIMNAQSDNISPHCSPCLLLS